MSSVEAKAMTCPECNGDGFDPHQSSCLLDKYALPCGRCDGHGVVEPYWVTKEGTLVLVSGMTDSHLVNTIRFLRRNAPRVRLLTALAVDTLAGTTSGEMAGWTLEQEAEQLYRMNDDDFLEHEVKAWLFLLVEAERRGLQP